MSSISEINTIEFCHSLVLKANKLSQHVCCCCYCNITTFSDTISGTKQPNNQAATEQAAEHKGVRLQTRGI